MRLCVYCGSRGGDDARFAQAALDLGAAIARGGHALVYGGGRVGLMGTLADAVLGAGGHVTGVIPRALFDREVAHTGCSELLVVQTMHERKMAMAERADAFIALPGGIGTLEELYEMWSWRQLGYHDKPVALLNAAGYYAPLLAFMRKSVDAGFVSQRHHDLLIVDDDVASLLATIDRHTAKATAGDSYRLL
jgi:uncharacterized protein (TIGR00730 family)